MLVLRNADTWPWNIATCASRSQLTSSAFPYPVEAASAAAVNRQKRAAQSPMMRLQRIMRTKNPARAVKLRQSSSNGHAPGGRRVLRVSALARGTLVGVGLLPARHLHGHARGGGDRGRPRRTAT